MVWNEKWKAEATNKHAAHACERSLHFRNSKKRAASYKYTATIVVLHQSQLLGLDKNLLKCLLNGVGKSLFHLIGPLLFSCTLDLWVHECHGKLCHDYTYKKKRNG